MDPENKNMLKDVFSEIKHVSEVETERIRKSTR